MGTLLVLHFQRHLSDLDLGPPYSFRFRTLWKAEIRAEEKKYDYSQTKHRTGYEPD